MAARFPVVLAVLLVSGVAQAEPSPYAADTGRATKALSSQESDDLAAGRGMGLARAAELNGWPGPGHSIELAGELGLRADQLQTLGEAKARMSAQARDIGRQIIEAERELDQAFAEGTVTPERMQQLSEKTGLLRGQLRAVHLAAHLTTRAILTDEQVGQYNRLRGYTAPPIHHH